jgi:hypothetical protein
MTDRLRLDQRLVESDFKPLGQRVPEAIHRRVEHLCELAFQAGERREPSKMEMLAALLLGCPTDPQELRRLLRAYGDATVATALPWAVEEGAEVIDLPARRSGPRSRRSG